MHVEEKSSSMEGPRGVGSPEMYDPRPRRDRSREPTMPVHGKVKSPGGLGGS
jgi:hypothetical protein